MRFLQTIALLGFLALASAHQTAESSELAQQAARKCNACHKGDLAFTGQTEAELSAKIKDLLANPAKHPRIRLGDTSDEAITALSRALLAE